MLWIKVFLCISLGVKAVATIYSIGEPREALTATDVIFSFGYWGSVIYMATLL